MSREKGFLAEAIARDYLVTNGLIWVESNYTCRFGEIDLIMRERNAWVFVEVRARVSAAFGGAIASVTPSKQQKIIKTASHYMLVNRLKNQYPVRLDVVGLQGDPPQIAWIKNAFGADS